MTTYKYTRLDWLDTAKGIGIVAVVIGHSGSSILSSYIFWFHMPLFFTISGFLMKPATSWPDLKENVIKRLKQLLIPYISFFILVFFLKVIYEISFNEFNPTSSILDVIKMVYGGQALTGFYATFWFITCLLVTQAISSIILLLSKDLKIQIVIIGSLFFIAHIESWFSNNYIRITLPWNADVSLIAITYFFFGYYMKLLDNKVNHKIIAPTVVIASILILYLGYIGVFQYSLDMKYLHYNNFFLDLLIPITLSLSVIYISIIFSKIPLLKLMATELGISSITIMYLHFAIRKFLELSPYYNVFTFTIVGVFIPLAVSKILEKNNLTSFFFLGRMSKEKYVMHQKNLPS
ncbi:hypothetical protein D3P07_25105 [Paenibacillus sp. 1011MAR3C5]|uniref:acyltransferase family protein n=1 Tax=Paenibacillus sp. 1011MAR3C5 TaxID=1675787 RepID=UPI000E6CD184|nr:acyltransferase family protein [Paenibacillus sp. 1011MAR3C5]RJE83630.1 hypothetical protein D3P07_25105 [Paenibacillus sp. 1011MAR3C5]